MLGAVLISERRRRRRRAGWVAAAVALCVAPASCSAAGGGENGKPLVVVTTSILGDVVANLVGDRADVDVLMGAGADPHEFTVSARQAAAMRDAKALVASGLGFEAGMLDAIDAARADGVPVLEVGPEVDPIETDGEPDPHWFTDPQRMVAAVPVIASFLTEHSPALGEEISTNADAYAKAVGDADSAIEETLAVVPPAQRKLVTNHESFTYFSDRYGFELIGAVIPNLSTEAAPSAQDLDELAATIEAAGVPAVFAEVTQSTRLADALADEVGGSVEVVPLYSEALGPPGSGAETYIGMMTTDARLIADALT